MWQDVLKFALDSIENIGVWWNWLTTPLAFGLEWLTPLTILSASGFAIIIGFWIAKLIIPL